MGMGVRIHITDMLIPIGTVLVGIGTTDIGPTIRGRSVERDSIAGAKPGEHQFVSRRVKIPPALFFRRRRSGGWRGCRCSGRRRLGEFLLQSFLHRWQFLLTLAFYLLPQRMLDSAALL
jgi:hypothetical protein